jgi:hypothetical protein
LAALKDLAPLRALAELLLASAEGKADLPLRPVRDEVEKLAASPLPERIVCQRQEGFAFYALHLEVYARAARQAKNVEAVIGIRSIGVGLAALVAAATDAAFFTSVRPRGPPFRREASISPAVAAALKATTGVIAVADEGPGLSGSSLLSVVTRSRVWASRCRASRSFRLTATARDGRPIRPHAATLEHARAPCRGACSRPLAAVDRHHRPISRAARPGLKQAPATPMWERQKLLREGARGTFLLRFAGLGPYGREIFLSRAHPLADAGFTPRPLGLRGGYLLEEWIGGAAPLDAAERHDLSRASLGLPRLSQSPVGGGARRRLVDKARGHAAPEHEARA